jgi:hypothetical protein
MEAPTMIPTTMAVAWARLIERRRAGGIRKED